MSGDLDAKMRALLASMGVQVWEGEEAEAHMYVLMASIPLRWTFSRRDYIQAHRENEARDRERRDAQRERRGLPPLHKPGDADAVGRALRGRQMRDGSWRCRCVVHDDRNPSMTVRDGHSQLLVRCWSRGCSPTEILRELRRRGIIGHC
jgi:hypothetical protein